MNVVNTILKDYLNNLVQNPTTTEDLKKIMAKKSVKVAYDTDRNLAIFKYDVNAVFTDDVVKCCRGTILSYELEDGKIRQNSFEYVCRAFDKFGNWHEDYADTKEIDWSTVSVQQKVDGSLMKVFYYGNKWNISSMGTIDANTANINESGTKTYGKKFESVVERKCGTVEAFFDNLEKVENAREYTFIFELVSEDTKIVIDYQKDDIYHIGTRNNRTGEEYRINLNEVAGVEYKESISYPIQYKLDTLEKCLDAVEQLNTKDSLLYEGFVIVDGAYRRVKVKSSEYLKAHYVRFLDSKKSVIKLLYSDDVSAEDLEKLKASSKEAREKIEGIENEIKELRNKIGKIVEDWKVIYQGLADIEDRNREFAKRVNTEIEKKYRVFVFSCVKVGKSFEVLWSEIDGPRMVRLLEWEEL